MKNNNLVTLVAVMALVLAGIALVVALQSRSAQPLSDAGLMQRSLTQADSVGAATGNGAPSGTHYNLNILGVPKEKTADMTGNSGHRIFVPLVGKTNIALSMGDFMVLDANGTDGKAAFQLPNPDPTNSGYTTYSVWSRALGKPGGKSTTTPCAQVLDELTGTYVDYCSTQQMVTVREKGGSKFSNVSSQLLYVYADLNADGTVERYPLFDAAMENYYWAYDNAGLKLVQLRFYPVSTNVN